MKFGIFAGLGNQLFQLAAAHAAAEYHKQAFNLIIDAEPPKHRPFELSNLISLCKHVNETSFEVFPSNSLFDRINTKLQISKLPFKVNFLNLTDKNYEADNFVYDIEGMDLNRLNIGYYQHWKYVKSAWPLINHELNSYVDSFNTKKELGSNIVVHIRRGDTVENKKTMGLLDENYYFESLERHRQISDIHKILVITDDFVNAQPVAKAIGADRIYDPKELSAWETLKLMKYSDSVIAANSTLSWWGALLCQQRGGVAYIPDPWFRNWKTELGDAFHFPGMIKIQSSFENF